MPASTNTLHQNTITSSGADGPYITVEAPKFKLHDHMAGHISVSRARRILGPYAKQFSDDQVRELLHTLHLLAREQLWYNGSKEGMSSHESSVSNEP